MKIINKSIKYPLTRYIRYYLAIILKRLFFYKSIPTCSEFFTKNGDCIYEKPWIVSPKR